MDAREPLERLLRRRLFLLGPEACAVCKEPEAKHQLRPAMNGDQVFGTVSSECGVIPREMLESKTR